MKKKLVLSVIMSMIVLGLLSGCGMNDSHHDPEVFHVSFISSVPTQLTEEMEAYILEVLGDDLPSDIAVNVKLFLPSHDRLTIEMIDRQADVIIVDEGLEQLMLDPYYLAPVDQFSEEVDEALGSYTAVDDRTGEEHLYQLPLRSESAFRQAIGYDLPFDLVIGIVGTSPHQALGEKLLAAWL
ncbi:MAG: hypothetical protein ACQER2_05355 [Bacillota bacterium]